MKIKIKNDPCEIPHEVEHTSTMYYYIKDNNIGWIFGEYCDIIAKEDGKLKIKISYKSPIPAIHNKLVGQSFDVIKTDAVYWIFHEPSGTYQPIVAKLCEEIR
jgi:hypothetical protein